MGIKIYLLIVLLTFKLNLNSQTFMPNFLGTDFHLYKGVLMKLGEETSSNFSYTFYDKIEYVQSPYDGRVIFPDKKYSFLTIRDSLKNKVFIVENIIDKSGAEFKKDNLLEKPIFILKDTASKEKIYFLYDIKYKHNFPFESSIIKNDIDPCSQIEKNIDEFTDEIKFNSPLIYRNELTPIRVYKFIKNGKTTYYLRLASQGSTVSVDGKGAIILFTDGSKMTKQVKIDVEVDEIDFEYSAFINLTLDDLRILRMKKIKKFRLYIYDRIIETSEAELFKNYVNCIMKNK